jgi:RNA polymerase sigma factor (sigma-70 family)
MNADFNQRIEDHRDMLTGYLARHAGPPLLRFDTVDDLVQGTILEALGSASDFQLRTQEEWRAWLFTLARRHVMRRREYWFSLKRDSRAVVKLTLTGSRGSQAELSIPDPSSGPVTRADRSELQLRITKAMAMLLPRDREIVRLSAEGSTTEDLSQHLEITKESASQARLRAFGRLKKAYQVLEQKKL